MSARATGWALEQPLPPVTKLVLIALADECRRNGTTCFPARRTLSECVGIKPRALSNHLAKLEEKGYIYREDRHRDNGSRTSTLYHLALDGPLAPSCNTPPASAHATPPCTDVQDQSLGSEPVRSVTEDQRSSVTSHVGLVFSTWVEATGKNGNTQLSDDRRKLIRSALTGGPKHGEGYPVEDLLDAVRGWRWSKHHRGENERGRAFNDLELLLRDCAKIEFFRDLERENGGRGEPQEVRY